jgi:hypothetical protein
MIYCPPTNTQPFSISKSSLIERKIPIFHEESFIPFISKIFTTPAIKCDDVKTKIHVGMMTLYARTVMPEAKIF